MSTHFSNPTRARLLFIPFLLGTALAATSAHADVYVDDFDGGVNPSGWAFIRGGDVFENSGGNPDGWLHQPSYDTFAPTLDCVYGASTPFVADYRATNVSRISLDAQTLDVDFGDGDGFSLTLVLRNSHGTPSNFDDDDYVYFVGPNVPRVGEGWVHYDFEVPSQSEENLPPGWKGGWAGDCENLRPGVTWSDVMTQVERVELWWIDPCFFAIFQNWNVGADNLEIEFGDPADAPDGSLPMQAGRIGLWPNPASNGAAIQLDLPRPGAIGLDVISASGRIVREIFSGELRGGLQDLRWDGLDARGGPVPAGTYYVRLRDAGGTISKPLVVLR